MRNTKAMRKTLFSLLLLSCLHGYSQTESPRNLKLGVTIGRSQTLVADEYMVNGKEAIGVSTFETMLNQFGINASLGSFRFPQINYNLNIGYQTIQTAYGVPVYNSLMYHTDYKMPVLYVKPGVGISVLLSERWKFIPSLNASLNTNLDRDLRPSQDLNYTAKRFFVTVNPAVEFQMNADGPWYLSLYLEYQIGLSPVLQSYAQDQDGFEKRMGVYNGSAANFGLKLAYCLPCAE